METAAALFIVLYWPSHSPAGHQSHLFKAESVLDRGLLRSIGSREAVRILRDKVRRLPGRIHRKACAALGADHRYRQGFQVIPIPYSGFFLLSRGSDTGFNRSLRKGR